MRALALVVFSCAVLLSTAAARADDGDVKAARAAFVRASELVKDADWAGALASFEDSSRLLPHPVTSFNIGACHRAMGQYTRARGAFARALEQSGPRAALSPALAEETRRYVGELDKLLAALDLTLLPAGASLAIDGRPLEDGSEIIGSAVLVAGTAPPGPGKPVPQKSFRVALDPGTHVLTIHREGFADVVQKETLAPGAQVARTIELDRLPAHLRLTSTPPGAQVLVDDADVGLSPVMITRPSGRYRIAMRKPGFLPFATSTAAEPGQDLAVAAPLREDKPTLTQRWWFWTGIGVVVTGAALTTFVLTRPEPERPPLDGGGLGWTARSP